MDDMTETHTAEEINCLIPVLKSAWDNKSPDDNRWWLGVAEASMKREGALVGDVSLAEVRESPTIDGLRLHIEYDEDGNEVPPYVLLRFKAMAIRHKAG